jgi:hypothetical protein
VKAPGVIATLVAPVAAQLRVLLAPELMLVGAAVNDVIVGADPFAGDEFETPQLTSPTQLHRRIRTKPVSLFEKARLLEKLLESKGSPSMPRSGIVLIRDESSPGNSVYFGLPAPL